MRVWPFQIDGNGLERALLGIVAAAVVFVVRQAGAVAYAALQSGPVTFPPPRPKRVQREGNVDSKQHGHLGVGRRTALVAGIALGGLGLVAVLFSAAIVGIFGVFAATAALGYFLGPPVAATIWALLAAMSILLPPRMSSDPATTLGRMYRSARATFKREALIGTTVFVLVPSPILGLIRWSDTRLADRTGQIHGAPPWATDPLRARRVPAR
jgi:hypothetical protein